jgi:hypothetical protein
VLLWWHVRLFISQLDARGEETDETDYSFSSNGPLPVS